MPYTYQFNEKDSFIKSYRNTMLQERVAIADLGEIIEQQVNSKGLFGKL